MDLNVIYDLHLFIEMKERGSFQTYAELDRIYNLGQLDLVNEYIDEYARNGKIHNALQPFKTLTVATSANGLISLPTDYLLVLPDCYTYPDYGQIRFYNENEWVAAIKSQLRPANAANPIAKLAAGKINLYPKSAITAAISYIRKPNAPVYAYTQVGRTITYNAGASTQLEWLDIEIPKVIMKSMSYIGINLREQDILSFAEMKEKQTV